jgi:ABC-type phosphate transport system substrate-binding protein
MHPTRTFALLAVVALGLQAQAAVIANEKVATATLPKDDAKNILLGSKTSWDGGGKIVLAILTGEAGDPIVNDLTGKNASNFQTHWKRLVFTGKAGMPKMFTKPEEVVEFVKSTEGALGIVPDGVAAAGTKAIALQ